MGFTSKIGASGTRVGVGVTVWQCNRTGFKIMFEMCEGLDTQDVLEHTLMNPNQTRAYGIQVCDDAWDPYRQLGIELTGKYNMLIPMMLEGLTAKFYTHAPSDEEMQELYPHRVRLTSDHPWNPHRLIPPKMCQLTTHVDVHPMNEYPHFVALRSRVNALALEVCDNQEFDAGLMPDFDEERKLSLISTSLTDETLLPQIISNVMIDGSHNAFTAASEDRHSDISPESLSRKWNIGLQTAKETLKKTLQQGIRSAVHPITRRYQTDLMTMNFRRLKARFYVDNVPVNCKSLWQHQHFMAYSGETVPSFIRYGNSPMLLVHYKH